MRNLGGSIGIAVAATLLVRRSQVHQAYLAASATRTYPPLAHHFSAMGGFTRKNLLALYGQVQVQAAMLSYLDVFRVLTILCVVVIGAVLLLRRVRMDEQRVPGH
jgi:DHA2 family multidrug resistance protein